MDSNSSNVSTILKSLIDLTTFSSNCNLICGGKCLAGSEISSSCLNCSLKCSTNCCIFIVVIQNCIFHRLSQSSLLRSSFGLGLHMLLKILPHRLCISCMHIFSNNGFSHVSQQVFVQYRKHGNLFCLK